jgi:hypothetical protein
MGANCYIYDNTSKQLDSFDIKFDGPRTYNKTWKANIDVIDKSRCKFYWTATNYEHLVDTWDDSAPNHKSTTWLMDSRGTRRIKEGNQEVENKITNWDEVAYTIIDSYVGDWNMRVGIGCSAYATNGSLVDEADLSFSSSRTSRKTWSVLHSELHYILCKFQFNAGNRNVHEIYIYGKGAPRRSSTLYVDMDRIRRRKIENITSSDFDISWHARNSYLDLQNDVDVSSGNVDTNCLIVAKETGKIEESFSKSSLSTGLSSHVWKLYFSIIDYGRCTFRWNGKIADSFIWGKNIPSVSSRWLVDSRGIRRIRALSNVTDDFITLWEDDETTTTTTTTTTSITTTTSRTTTLSTPKTTLTSTTTNSPTPTSPQTHSTTTRTTTSATPNESFRLKPSFALFSLMSIAIFTCSFIKSISFF